MGPVPTGLHALPTPKRGGPFGTDRADTPSGDPYFQYFKIFMIPLVEVKNLRTYFHTPSGVVKAVDDVSFEIQKGESI